MPATRTKKGAASKATTRSTTTKKLSRPTKAPQPPPAAEVSKNTDLDANSDKDDDEGGYETAQEEESWARVLRDLKGSDTKRKTDTRKKRERKFDDDMQELKTAVEEDMVPSDEDATRQRTKAAMLNLIQQLKKRSELEKTYLDTTEELHQEYLRINAELILATKGRLEEVMKVEIIDIEP